MPVIGIIKRTYDRYPVYVTPTIREVDELMEVKPEIIAMDATSRIRPDGKTLDVFVQEIRSKYPKQLLMADCATFEEMVHADELGFDFIGTTLVGYTKQSEGMHIEKVRRVLDLGCYSAVVGSCITRPHIITRRFTDAIHRE